MKKLNQVGCLGKKITSIEKDNGEIILDYTIDNTDAKISKVAGETKGAIVQ